jgi:DNA-binding MarR family transcriptional regulator
MRSKENSFTPEFTEQETGLLLWQTARQWEKTVRDTLAKQDFSYLEYILLSRLLILEKREKEITQVKLAQFSNAEIMLTSKALRSLEEKGLIRRKKFNNDSRANLISSTDKGSKKLDKVQKTLNEVENNFFSALDAKKNLLNKSLQKVFAAQSF